jgi:preprotein translocase subunit SecD
MKPELQWSAKKAAEAAEWAGDEALAAVEGFFEGWFAPEPVNVNRASERQLEKLPGVTAQEAQRIIGARPYHDKRELVKKGAITESAYARIKNDITAD